MKKEEPQKGEKKVFIYRSLGISAMAGLDGLLTHSSEGHVAVFLHV